MLPFMHLQVGIVSGEICKAEFQDKLRNQSLSELNELYDLYMIYFQHQNGKLSQVEQGSTRLLNKVVMHKERSTLVFHIRQSQLCQTCLCRFVCAYRKLQRKRLSLETVALRRPCHEKVSMS